MKVPFNAAVVLLAICAAPIAFAQTPTPKKKKGAKPAASASASATEDTPPPPPPAPEQAPSDSSSKDSAPKDDAKSTKTDASASAASGWDSSDTREDRNKKYQFIGLRYRGTIIPQFFESLFVDDGATVYSNSIGIEWDRRQDGQSMIPWLMYSDYGMGDTLFLTKGKDPNLNTEYSVVNSSLKALYVGIDELWSMPLADHLEFEYGFGVGIGVV